MVSKNWMVYSNNEQILNYKHKIVTTLRRSEHHEQEQMKGNTSEVIEWLYQKQSNIRKIINSSMVNLFRIDLFAPPPPRSPLSLNSVAQILQSWNLEKLYHTQRRSKKYMNHLTEHLSSAEISIFSPEISKFCFIKKYRYRLHFDFDR